MIAYASFSCDSAVWHHRWSLSADVSWHDAALTKWPASVAHQGRTVFVHAVLNSCRADVCRSACVLSH